MKNGIYIVLVFICAFTIWSDHIFAQNPGNALDFDGSNDYVTIPDAAALDITDQITIEAWFKSASSSWAYKKLITVDNTKVSATLTNFPVLLSVTDAELKDTDNGGPIQPDGDDILFLSTNGTKLSHEIDEYDGSTGKLIAWVKIPSLSSSGDTEFYLYYGNPGCSSQQDAANVWDSNYIGVWHLNEATDAINIDATSNNNDGTPQNSPASIAGKIDGALDFEGAAQTRVDVGTAGSLDLSLESNWTMSAWVKPSTNYVDSKYPTIYTYGDYKATLDVAVAEGPEDGRIEHYRNDNDGLYSNTVMNITSWNHVVVVYEPDTTRFYLNGIYDGFGTSVTINQDNSGSCIGGYPGYNDGDLLGLIDEVRVSSSVRDSSWIATEYNNQNSPGTFLSLGSETLAGVSKSSAYGISTNNTNAYGTINDQTLSGSITAGEWNHICLTYNKDAGGIQEMKLYINGTRRASGDYATAITTNNDNLTLSNFVGLLGKMDELRLWNDVRTELEIRENLHRVVTPGSEPNLAAYWQFNASSGTSAADSSGTNTGTLTNMTDADWVSSTAPFGGGLASSKTFFQVGTANLGTFSMTITDPFDLQVEMTSTEILNGPNILPAAADSLEDRYWVVDVFGMPGTYAANVTFTLPDGYLQLGEESNLKLYNRSSNSDGSWNLLVSGAASMTATTVTFENVSTLGQFTITGSSGFPMPVEMTSFTGTVEGENIILRWQTETEVNNYGFEVQRSAMYDHWELVGFVEGHGNSNSPKEYEFTDDLSSLEDHSLIDSVTYRLKQIDLDGIFEYHYMTASVNLRNITGIDDETIPVEYELFQNYPNPFNPTSTIKFGLPESSRTLLEIYNTLGQKAATLIDREMNAGYHEVEWNASEFTSGIYLYKITTKNYTDIKKMLLLK